MSLLREIQDATTAPGFKLADVLRKAKILAARLDHQAFKEWIERELNGYKSIDELPEYRTLRGIPSYGDFFGPFNSGVRNAPIPMSAIPEDFRDPISTVHLYQGVEALDSLLKSAEGIIIRMPWVADAVTYIQPRVYEHMHCATAWRMVPVSAIAAITDTIKTRILDFALEIET
jgi:hypothetical protein